MVNGKDAQVEQFPWIAAIGNPGETSRECGGTLIAADWILTEAHCFLSAAGDAADTSLQRMFPI